MSTLSTINAGDQITDSRTVINDNFTALNNDKIETSVLDTDTTLAANSDAKIPSQKAVKAYVDAGGNVNASTTAKGIVEEATEAEVAAGTTSGGTGARLFVSPATMPRPALTVIPHPLGFDGTVVGSKGVVGNTTGFVGLLHVPLYITVNKVSFRTDSSLVAGTMDVTLYTEDGQTQLFSVTTASVSASNTIYTTAVSSVTLRPGNYYLMISANSTASATIYSWKTAAAPFSTTAGLLEDVSSEPVLVGTYTITADTPPATITPTSITGADDCAFIVRLDN